MKVVYQMAMKMVLFFSANILFWVEMLDSKEEIILFEVTEILTRYTLSSFYENVYSNFIAVLNAILTLIHFDVL